jgi:hypothetical protein
MFKRSVPGWRAEGDCLRWESFEAFHLLGQGPAFGHAKTKKRPARLARLARLARPWTCLDTASHAANISTSAQDDVPGYARIKHWVVCRTRHQYWIYNDHETPLGGWTPEFSLSYFHLNPYCGQDGQPFLIIWYDNTIQEKNIKI